MQCYLKDVLTSITDLELIKKPGFTAKGSENLSEVMYYLLQLNLLSISSSQTHVYKQLDLKEEKSLCFKLIL